MPGDLTVGEVLEMTARWYSRPRAPDELIDLVELDAKRETRIEKLSGGQRRRLDLAVGLAGLAPTSCSSTSRPPASIPTPAAPPGRRSARCAATGRPSC